MVSKIREMSENIPRNRWNDLRCKTKCIWMPSKKLTTKEIFEHFSHKDDKVILFFLFFLECILLLFYFNMMTLSHATFLKDPKKQRERTFCIICSRNFCFNRYINRNCGNVNIGVIRRHKFYALNAEWMCFIALVIIHKECNKVNDLCAANGAFSVYLCSFFFYWHFLCIE